MSQPPSASQASVSPFARIAYEQARSDLRALHDTIAGISDKIAARTWAEKFGQRMVRLFRSLTFPGVLIVMQRDLSDSAEAAGVVLLEDTTVQGLLNSSRDLLASYITSDWLELAPDLVRGLESMLRRLDPGVSLGEAYPNAVAGIPRPAAPVVPPVVISSPMAPAPAPTTSLGPGPSLTVPLPLSRSPSSGSGDVGPPGPGSDAERVSRPQCSLPRACRQLVLRTDFPYRL
jgi:hypothetical protein